MKTQKYMIGVSLIELMIAVLLSIFLSTAIVDVALTASRVNRQVQLSSEVIENGRYLTQLLNRELGLAGFYGWLKMPLSNSNSNNRPDFCTEISTADLSEALNFAVEGLDDAAKDERLCSGDALLVGSDLLVIRRTHTDFFNSTIGLLDKQHYIQANGDAFVLELGTNNEAFNQTQKDGITAAPIRAFIQTIYYVAADNVFKRRRLLKGKYAPAEPLVEGVDDFQVEYGIDRSGNGLANADGAKLAYVERPISAQEWASVVSIRYYLLLSSTDPAPGVNDVKRYTYADKIDVGFANAKVRRLFSGVTQLRNHSARRQLLFQAALTTGEQ
ncbi:PilW family protein [Porticoccaceae bacterium]|nr:PilW family protein [Porticoccaceae bacterium]